MLVNNKRALAHIETVSAIEEIPGADNICKIYVLGWALIAKKGEFNVGDKCVYIEIDSKVPESDKRFEFLSKRCYKVKTMKLNSLGVISQGLALNISEFPEFKNKNIGDDVTDALKITKILTNEEKRLAKEEEFINNAANRMRLANATRRHPKLFNSKLIKSMLKNKFWKRVLLRIFGGKYEKPKLFPAWINKTDEERCENLVPGLFEHKEELICTEKIDGTSTTFAVRYDSKHKKYEKVICSRNVRQETEVQSCYFDENVYWKIWNSYNIEKVLTETDYFKKYDLVILQGETYGHGLQGNPYKLDNIFFRGYNLIVGYASGSKMYEAITHDPNLMKDYIRVGDTIQRRISSTEAKNILLGQVEWVPILDVHYTLPNDIETLKQEATGTSVLADVMREGCVYRSESDPTFSFKNVSREYLASKKD